MIKRNYLSLAMAKIMVEAIEKKAKELGLKIVIAILDDGGNLKYFQRMDGTSYGSIRISKLKAKTSASLPLSTRALGDRNAKMANGPYGSIPDIVLLPGGLPIITAEGELLGSVGISGATPDLDEACAQAGIEAIQSLLN